MSKQQEIRCVCCESGGYSCEAKCFTCEQDAEHVELRTEFEFLMLRETCEHFKESEHGVGNWLHFKQQMQRLEFIRLDNEALRIYCGIANDEIPAEEIFKLPSHNLDVILVQTLDEEIGPQHYKEES